MKASRPGVLCGSAFFRAARISTSAVASTSTHTVASGISERLRVMLAATAFRTPRTAVRPVMPRPVRESVSPPAPDPDSVGAGSVGAAAGRADSAGLAAGAIAASTSLRMMSPLAPEPWSPPKSTPWSRAIRRTSGEMTAPSFPGTRVRISSRSSAAFSSAEIRAGAEAATDATALLRARLRRATPCPPGVPYPIRTFPDPAFSSSRYVSAEASAGADDAAPGVASGLPEPAASSADECCPAKGRGRHHPRRR